MMIQKPPAAGPRGGRILIVDDKEENIRLLTRLLTRAGYESLAWTTDPSSVANLYAEFKPDLVLLDLRMPGRDGFDVLRELGPFTRGEEHLPVLMLTGEDTPDVKRQALALGAKDFVGKPFDTIEVMLRIQNLLETRFLHRTLQENNALLETKVGERTKELEESRLEVLERLAAVVEFRDDDTGIHTRRVGELSALIAGGLGLSRGRIETLRRAAPLHDIGKIGIPDSILLKPGSLTTAEFEIMKTHSAIGARMLVNGRSELVRVAERIARSHHEHWDGQGYPDGLSRDAIPLDARIVAVADFFDALTHDRPYRAAWSTADTIAAIKLRGGNHFDPDVTAAFVALNITMALASVA
ncbi:MAG TPA: HD domain-containing phosphohydrolase [Gemmatimonadaceae bacterium]|nr:HD domain-containing phosphohydrolase [Gemmatimonadaceae bacterium]